MKTVAGLGLRERVRSSDVRREGGVEPLLRRKEAAEVVRASDLDASWTPPGRLPLDQVCRTHFHRGPHQHHGLLKGRCNRSSV